MFQAYGFAGSVARHEKSAVTDVVSYPQDNGEWPRGWDDTWI
jgi:hypothetical protein